MMKIMRNRMKLMLIITTIVLVGILSIWQGTRLLADSPVTDSFADTSKIASVENLTVDTANGRVMLSASLDFTCGEDWIDSRDGQTYATVLLGDQCWMAQNMNVGTRIDGANNQGSTCTGIEKYCYGNNESNCDTYGGLYQWDQAMCGSAVAGAQGICPVGWHIPTHDEFTVLERMVCESGSCATDFPFDTSTTGWRGTNEGTSLKSGGSSGFEGLLAGLRNTNGSFGNVGSATYFWSSVQSGTNAWRRFLNASEDGVHRNTVAKASGFSVRCLKD